MELADGFGLSFSWGAGSDVGFHNNCIHPDSQNGKTITYGIWSRDDNYYVTHFELTGFEGTWKNLDIPVDQQWHFNQNITTGYSLGSVSVTYSNVPALSIFESDGENAYKIKSKDDLRHLANYVNNGNNDCIGLFGWVKGGTVQNVTLSNSSFTGKNYVGGIVGNNMGGTIENCRVESNVTIHAGYDNAAYLGGITGGND